jgi:hypothetical protein
MYHLARCRLASGQTERGVALLEKLLKEHPDSDVKWDAEDLLDAQKSAKAPRQALDEPAK